MPPQSAALRALACTLLLLVVTLPAACRPLSARKLSGDDTLSRLAGTRLPPLPERTTLTTLPWNTTFARDERSYVHIGWRRTLASSGKAQRPPITEWDDRPGCTMLREFVFWPLAPDAARMTYCKGAAPAADAPSAVAITPQPAAVDVAICVKPTRGPLNATWLSDWMSWHAALGVGAFYIYAIDYTLGDGLVPRDITPPMGTHLHWLNVSWLSGFDSRANGQVWHNQDCLYRIKSTAAATWALYMDLDELLTLPPLSDGVAGLTRFLDARGLGAATFGSVPYLPTVCAPASDERVTLAQRVVYRTRHAEGCAHGRGAQTWGADAWRMCLGATGRRKLIVRIANATQMDTHSPPSRDFKKDAIVELDAAVAWLKHVRNAPFAASGSVCGGETRCVPFDDGAGMSGVTCTVPAFAGDEGARAFTAKLVRGESFYDEVPFIAEAAKSVLGALPRTVS